MEEVARIALEGGGAIFVEAGSLADGPVKASRPGDAIRDLPSSLQSLLGPVRDAARAMVDQLRQAGPDEVEVQFGVNLSAQAGAVITKTGAGCHLTVRVMWKSSDRDKA